ncbi:Planctomycete cytochrome C [Rubripirellula reticaptiva]|uniref:Planctomycete cytochrome C n=2 Tax=Rubripirellula reticaptiva TaxID=2528013 RepID=A0A5C6F8P5_9BACT|nr:Planctomycete cytochrome C [Rubripirellula reticaptiva]
MTTVIAGSIPSGDSLTADASEPTFDFVRDIASVFQQHCIECHGPADQNGGLRLDQSLSVFAEADSGERAIVRGKPDESELLTRITSTNEDDQMPPEGDRLTTEEIETIRRWIKSDADWPAMKNAGDTADQQDEVETSHWAFQPITRPEPPSVKDAVWSRHPIDRFMQSRREETDMPAAPMADPITLVRRATYDLTGLPPTPAEVTAFVKSAKAKSTHDESATTAAFETLVENLLQRPTYGQRWGRHWMDWVRYADTAGDNSDFPIPQAYLYRNYIIDSLNQDVPYDRFLTEQLAGDLLPADSLEQRNRQTIATGYLSMARRFGSLVERYPWHLTIEDTIDNLGRTMMGMTIACARCHDHKFDPISTRDYYGLYGIFASTGYPFPGIELFQVQRDLVPLIAQKEVDEAYAPFAKEKRSLEDKLAKQLAACEKRSIENADREKTATVAEKRKMHDELEEMLGKARNAGNQLAAFLKKMPEIPTAYAVRDIEPVDAAIQIKGEPNRPGATVPRKFPDVLGGYALTDEAASNGSGRLELAKWITDPDNPLTARVIVNRVWQRHFGRGLVPSTSDFGLRGETPSHPKLLDWLANDFIQNGWSLKHLHHTIMTSRTYQLSSRDVIAKLAPNLVQDPDNRLHWRFNRQRLDAESIRDTLLMIGGNLDLSPQQDPYPFPPRDKWEFTQHHPFNANYDSNRRSVYQMTKRLTAQTYQQTFDGPDPNACTSSRDESVTALQALYFINDDFLHDQAGLIAQRFVSQHDNDTARIEDAFLTILNRPATTEEVDWMSEHLRAVGKRLADTKDLDKRAWTSLTLSLLRLNEFLYLD